MARVASAVGPNGDGVRAPEKKNERVLTGIGQQTFAGFRSTGAAQHMLAYMVNMGRSRNRKIGETPGKRSYCEGPREETGRERCLVYIRS